MFVILVLQCYLAQMHSQDKICMLGGRIILSGCLVSNIKVESPSYCAKLEEKSSTSSS